MLASLVLAQTILAACTTSIALPPRVPSGSTFAAPVTFPENWSVAEINVTDYQSYHERRLYSAILPAAPDFNFRVRFPRTNTLLFSVIAETFAGDLCTAKGSMVVDADPELAARSFAVVLPVGGSVGPFRTRLRLSGFSSGRIYFRRSGGFAGDTTDPSIRYQFETPPIGVPFIPSIEYTDLATAMSVDGIGSFDIVPDITDAGNPRFPHVEAEIYSDTPHGRHGFSVPILVPRDVFPRGFHVIRVTARAVSGMERVNVGIRTFEKEVTARIIVDKRGSRSESRRTFGPQTFQQLPLRELVASPLAAGDQVLIAYEGGAVSASHSIVQSGTNDSLVIAPYARIPFEHSAAADFHVP